MKPETLRIILLLTTAVVFTIFITSLVSLNAQTCPPGYFEMNSSGTFFCVPPPDKKPVSPFFTVSSGYNASNNTLVLRFVCLMAGGCRYSFSVLYPWGDVLYSNSSITLSEGYSDTYNIAVSNQSASFVVINVSASSLASPDLYMYNVVFAQPIIRTNIYAQQLFAINDMFLKAVLSLLIVAPVLSLVLTQKTEASGVALIVTVPLYIIFATYIGVPYTITLFIAVIMLVIGIYYVSSR